MKPEQPSDKLEVLIEESLRSETFQATPPGFWGRVTRAVEADIHLRRARRAWHLRWVATMSAFAIAVVFTYLLIGASGLVDSVMASIPGAYGLVDHVWHAARDSASFFMIAVCLLPTGLLVGVLREFHFHQREVTI